MRKICSLLIIALIVVSCSTSTKVRVSKSNKNYSKSKTTTKVVSTKNSTANNSNNNTSATLNSTTSSSNSTMVLEATSKKTVTNDVIMQYIADYKSIAQDNMVNHKVPASITMAQGILESGSGTGTLALNANNHFGIKCHTGWTGESVRHDDDAAQECFRKYNDPAESYRDHSLFLTSRSRYNDLFKLQITDYKSWAKGLKAAGYATDPKYPDKLIALIERYNLHELDKVTTKDQTTLTIDDKPISEPVTSNVNYAEYIVLTGDTLYSIARKFNTTVQNIKKINNLSSDTISVGQILKM
jgi:flagellum-specific peptidoglycan hydrolase FlgJ